jgi:ribonuclease-3
LADVFESLVAAIYLDGGDAAAREFIERHVTPEIEAAAGGDHGGNYKSMLQQIAQRDYGMTPTYQLLDEKGPDHSKCFKISAQIGRNRYHPAWGRNKKEAEQRAALNALSELTGDPVPFPTD